MYSDGRSGRLGRCKRVLDSCRTLSKAPHGPDTSSPRPPASPNRNQRFLGSRTRKAAVHSRTAPAEAALLGPLVDGALLLAGQHQTAACCLTPAELNASAATSARCRPTPSKTQRTWPGHRLQASYLTTGKSAAGRRPQPDRCIQRRPPPPRQLHLRVRSRPQLPVVSTMICPALSE